MGRLPPNSSAPGRIVSICREKREWTRSFSRRWNAGLPRSTEIRYPEAQAIADMIATTSVNGYAGCASAIQKLNYLDSLDQITGLPVLFIAGLRMQAHHRPVWRRCRQYARIGICIARSCGAYFQRRKVGDFTQTLSGFWQNFGSRITYRRRVKGWIE